MLTKEQSGKLDGLTMLCMLPIQLVLVWFVIEKTTINVWLAAVLLIAGTVPIYAFIRGRLRRRLYSETGE